MTRQWIDPMLRIAICLLPFVSAEACTGEDTPVTDTENNGTDGTETEDSEIGDTETDSSSDGTDGTDGTETEDTETEDTETEDTETEDTETEDTETEDTETVDTETVDTETDSATGWLYTSGNLIKMNDGDGNPADDETVILHGVSMIDITTVSTDGGYQAQLDRMAQWNVNLVRMPVYPHDNTHGDTKPIGGWSTSNADTLFNTYLDPAVQYAKSKGMYVIVDLHYIMDITATSANNTTVRQFWTDMAPRYADDPMVLYEVYNEPINTGGTQNWNDWQPIVQDFVDIIRGHAPQNLVLVGGPKWSQKIGGCATNPVTGGNIVYVAHLYSWHYYGADGADIENQVETCHAAYPVMLTEWGGDNTTQLGYIAALIRDNGLSFTGWAFHNTWGPAMFSGGTDDVPSTWNVTTWGTTIDNFLDEY